MTVQDIDLWRGVLQTKEKLQISWFKASCWWIYQYEKKHKIVARKVTKFITHASVTKNKDLAKNVKNLNKRSETEHTVAWAKIYIYNSGQSDLNLEIDSGKFSSELL